MTHPTSDFTVSGRPFRGAVGVGLSLALAACGSDSNTAPAVADPVAASDAGTRVPLPVDDPQPVAAPLVCSADGWCWDSPVGPQGNTLAAIAANGPDDVWVVGELGVALHYDGEVWESRWSPARVRLRSVWLSGDEVWAVGDASTVLHYDGQDWTSEVVPGLGDDVELRGIAGRNGDLWAVGVGGTLLERRGGTWSLVELDVTARLSAVWAAADAVWAVGDTGTVLRYDGTEWTVVDAGTNRNLYAVHGTSDDVWIAGDRGEIRRYDPEEDTWARPADTGTRPDTPFLSLVVGADDRVVAAGSDGSVYLWDGTLTCPVEGDAGAPLEPCPDWGDTRASGQNGSLRGLWAAGDDAIAVGDLGAIVSWQGATRRVLSPASADNYLDVSGGGSDSVWVAGDRLMARGASGWREVERSSPRALYAVQPLADRVLVAGTGGVTRSYAAETWQDMDVRADAWLRGLWSDGQSGWLVGSRGYAWALLNQRVWTLLDTPTTNDLLGVWASEAGTAWAVGEGGVVLRHDGILWAQIPSGPNGGLDVDLRGVWGTGDTNVWAVGTGGTVLHYNGTLWTRATDDAPFALNDVWGRSETEIWAVGSGGTILRYDGSDWQPEFSGASTALNAVWGSSDRLWVVGENGTILSKPLP